MKIRHVALVGAGHFGRHHLRHLTNHERVGAVTVVDKDIERARTLAKAHGADVATTLEGCALDAAIIAVPTEAHFLVAAPLVARGIPVLIEKPVAATVEEAARLNAIAQNAGTFIQVGHIERFSAAFDALSKRCGPVRHIAARRHNPPRDVPPTVDVVLDLMIHDIDLALALAGAPVQTMTATAPDGIGQEAATAQLTFMNGVVADLSASRLAPRMERNLIVHAAGGVFHADLAQKSLLHLSGQDVIQIPTDGDRDNLKEEISSFLDVVARRVPPKVCGEAGLSALAVANEVRQALASVAYQLTA